MRLAAVSFALPLSVFMTAPLCSQKPLVEGSAFVDQKRNVMKSLDASRF